MLRATDFYSSFLSYLRRSPFFIIYIFHTYAGRLYSIGLALVGYIYFISRPTQECERVVVAHKRVCRAPAVWGFLKGLVISRLIG